VRTKKSTQQSIEELQKRFHEFEHQKTRVETNLENAKRRLQQLQAEAVQKYGTGELKDLENQLQQLKIENERKRADYQNELDLIEQQLVEIEEKFAEIDVDEDR
jgi:hypothetical protein